MAGLDSLKNDAEFWNFVSVLVAVEALGAYAEDKGASRARRRTRRTDVTQPAHLPETLQRATKEIV